MIDFTLTSTVWFLDPISREMALAESTAAFATYKSTPISAAFSDNWITYISYEDKDRLEGLIDLGVKVSNKLELDATYTNG